MHSNIMRRRKPHAVEVMRRRMPYAVWQAQANAIDLMIP